MRKSYLNLRFLLIIIFINLNCHFPNCLVNLKLIDQHLKMFKSFSNKYGYLNFKFFSLFLDSISVCYLVIYHIIS